ncbi:MAG: molybdate ABC transporter substrate-binding protein [Gammaproteobacteria bacterium]|nr:molybdate ABC transporter substrate-binding protein [Gammaproteobacteria bacterium]
MVGHLIVVGITWCVAMSAGAAEVRVAVAANFAHTLEQLQAQFEKATVHRVAIISGSTGKLFAQINTGAPFDVFLSADAEAPARLVAAGQAVASQFTYARGRLVLWSAQAELVQDAPQTLRKGMQRIALANPKLAPYGRAAEQALRALQLWDKVQRRVVLGENVSQTLQFAATANTAWAFVGLAQVFGLPPEQRGGYWEVPRNLYEPITQDAVLLVHGRDNPAAQEFLTYLRSAAARELIQRDGYE